MAIGIFNSLQFGGVDSADYGIYITGAGVFNAPSRAVEMVSVPGRNGEVALDMGHWNNIQIEYPAGCFGSDPSEFADNIAAFRNAILPLIGYQRLTDTYNPNEYRMALYTEGLEVDPVNMNEAGEFTLIFNAKPQRWLTSGESAVSVTSGDDLDNPTNYDASPLLALKGYGSINFNGYTVDVVDDYMGIITLAEARSLTDNNNALQVVLNSDGVANNGDTIAVRGSIYFERTSIDISKTYNALMTTYPSGASAFIKAGEQYGNLDQSVLMGIELGDVTFTKGTSGSQTFTAEGYTRYERVGSVVMRTATFTFTLKINYFSATDTIQVMGTISVSAYDPSDFTQGTRTMVLDQAKVDSTKSILGNPTYIDCDIGEAYKIVNDEVIGLNQFIALGSDLPTLASGNNTVTYDNTFTEVKITPRWWQL